MNNRMIKAYSFAILTASLLVLSSCDTPGSNSLFKEDVTFNPAPTITNVNPAAQYFAGYESITITGTNFSTVASENNVWFNDVKANVISASATQLVVNTPNYVADSIGLKVNVTGAIAFSNSIQYRLEALFEDATVMPPNTIPFGAGIDANGLMYISLIAAGVPSGLSRFDADGVETLNYIPAPPFQGWSYRVVKVGPDGGVYMLRVAGGVPLVYRIPPGGGSTTNWGTSVGRAEDLDFDDNGFAWVVGANETNSAVNQSIVRIQDNGATRSYVRFPFVANGHAVKVFNDFLYVAGTRGGNPFLWRFPINTADNTLGAEEQVADIGASYSADVVPRAITIGTDGTVYVALSGATYDVLPSTSASMLAVTPTGAVSAFYPGIIPGIVMKMHAIPGTQKVLATILPAVTGQTQRLITLNLQTDLAPYHGIE
jgi:hypothetical protein